MRYLKNGAANAIRTVRADRPDAAPTERVVGLSPVQIQRRFTAAATEVMLAGNWKTARMVRSPLGLDLCLTYRTFTLTRPMRLTWRHLYRQFGADPAKSNDKFT